MPKFAIVPPNGDRPRFPLQPQWPMIIRRKTWSVPVQSIVAPDSFATLPQRAVSAPTKDMKSSGVLLVTTLTPPAAKRCLISGDSSVASNTAWSFSTIGRGVPTGTNAPCHELLIISGYPASAIVGTCGNASIRLAVEMPSALSLPRLDEADRRRERDEHHLRFAAEQADDRRAGASLVGDVHDLQVGELHEMLHLQA